MDISGVSGGLRRSQGASVYLKGVRGYLRGFYGGPRKSLGFRGRLQRSFLGPFLESQEVSHGFRKFQRNAGASWGSQKVSVAFQEFSGVSGLMVYQGITGRVLGPTGMFQGYFGSQRVSEGSQ